MTAILKNREAALAAIILAMVAAIGAYAPTFVSIDNIIRVLNDTSILAMLALAQMMVILTRGIDLSTASALALAGADLPPRWHSTSRIFPSSHLSAWPFWWASCWG